MRSLLLQAPLEPNLLQDILQISVAVFVLLLVCYFMYKYFTKELDKKDTTIKEKDTEIAKLNLQIQCFINDIFENNIMLSNVMDKLLTGQLKGSEKTIGEVKEQANTLKNLIRDVGNQIDRLR